MLSELGADSRWMRGKFSGAFFEWTTSNPIMKHAKLLSAILLNCFLCHLCLADARLDNELFSAIDKALFSTTDKNVLRAVEAVFQKGGNVNATNAPQYSWTPLQRACELGHLKLVELLIAKGAKINIAVGGRTPLHVAAYNDRDDVVALLLSRGADPNTKGESDKTPLHWTVSNPSGDVVGRDPHPLSGIRYSNTVELLIANGANVNAKALSGSLVRYRQPYELDCIAQAITNRDNGITPLHLVVLSGNLMLEQLLIKHGADLNAQDLSGWTLMHWAAAYGRTDVIGRLTAQGADLNLKDKDGRTPLYYAMQFDCEDAIKQIRRLGGM